MERASRRRGASWIVAPSVVAPSIVALGIAAATARAGLPSAPSQQWFAHALVTAGPAVVQLTDDNDDDRIDERDHADVVVLVGNGGSSDVIAFDGPTGQRLFWVHAGLESRNGIAAGDIDGDGLVELVVRDRLTGEILVIEHDGSVTHLSHSPRTDEEQLISLADIDQDGSPEIVVGLDVFSVDGSPPSFRPRRRETSDFPCHAIDLDESSPGLEVLCHGLTYDSTGSVLWASNVWGRLGFGDLDGDAKPEVVITWTSGDPTRSALLNVRVLDANGRHLGNAPPIAQDFSRWEHEPVVADLDGDGLAEVAVALGLSLRAFDWDGEALTEAWSADTNDATPIMAVPSAFDFDFDGAHEIVYRDETHWLILDGRTGDRLHEEESASFTIRESPIVANLDGDCYPEIVTWSTTQGPLLVREVVGGAEPRRLWNQMHYRVTNVQDDATIPRFESRDWVRGTWRAQQAVGPCCRIDELPPLRGFHSACAGQEVALDATGITVTNCPEGASYSWWVGDTLAAQGPEAFVTPNESADYRLEITCPSNPGCYFERTTHVHVEGVPELGGVQARDTSQCNAGELMLSWPPAAFVDPLVGGYYAVYRAEGPDADCAAALASAPLVTGLAEPEWLDGTVTEGVDYWYAIEAIDLGGTACASGGPVSVTACAPGPVRDVALAPGTMRPDGVYAVLRAAHRGDQLTVSWDGARPLLRDESFVLLKARDVPWSEFSAVNPPGDLSRQHVELDVSSPLQFFDLRVIVPCGDMSVDEYPPTYDLR